MDLTLHALTKTQIIEQLKRCAEEHPTAPIRFMEPFGRVRRLRGVEHTKDAEICLHTLDKTNLAARNIIFNTYKKPIFLSRLCEILTEATEEIVTIDGYSAVGKIFMTHSEAAGCIVYMFPVPKNIEKINAYIAKTVKAKCKRCDKSLGYPCGSCVEVATCPLLEKLDKEVREKFPPK